jgi:hypothetical protein
MGDDLNKNAELIIYTPSLINAAWIFGLFQFVDQKHGVC